MNRYLLIFFLLIAINIPSQASTISKLKAVNSEWMNNFDGQILAATVNTDDNLTFNDWITTHLMLVEKTLRARSVDHLTFEQKENRTKLLDELNAYWHAGSYPINDYLRYKNPVFIDHNGTHCAVGYLMQQSGAETLARAIDRDDKFVYVKNIKTKGVAEWSAKNGFTIDELAWIQPAYQAQFNVGDMAGGLSGPVMTLALDPNTQMLYAGGSFSSSTSGNPCNGIASYISGIAGWEWIGVGNGGVDGTVNAILFHDNKIYVGGYFTSAGSVSASNIAVFDPASQQWQAMGSLDSSVYALAVYNNEIYAGGKFTGFVSKWTGSQWQDVALGFLYGEGVRTLEVWNGTLLIGGSFELATGAIRKNVAAYDGLYIGSSGMGTLTPVNDFEIFRDTVYAACDFVSGNDTCAIAKFVDYDWEIALKPYSNGFDSFDGNSIRSIISEQDKLFCAGEFSCNSGFYYGNHLMEFRMDPSGQNYCIPLLIVDDAINAIVRNTNTIVFGGHFSNALGDTLNHVGELYDVITKVPVINEKLSESLNVFPNPTTNSVQVRINHAASDGEYLIRIFNQMGQELYSRKISTPEFTSDIFSELSDGIYFVQASDNAGQVLGSGKVMVAH
jgi:hypothetical protein